MKKLAVFDVDGTIFRSGLTVELVDEFIKKNVFPKSAGKEIEKDYLAWINRKGSYEAYIIKDVEIFEKYIGGISQKTVDGVVKKIIDEQKDKTYVFTRDLIKKLKKEGYFLLAISGAPEMILESFVSKLGFDKFYGSQYEIRNKTYTGLKLRDTALIKKEIFTTFLKENNFSLKGSVGVGDSESDVAFLEFMETPIAFNPDAKLARVSKDKGWRIVVERKNVVYDLKDFDFKSTS